MVVRMKATRGHSGNRRAHHKLQAPRLGVDSGTGEAHLKHRVSPSGMYRGRQVLNVEKKVQAKLARREKRMKRAEASEAVAAKENTQLNPEGLSKS